MTKGTHTINVPANSVLFPTNIFLTAGDHVTIHASGTWTYYPGQPGGTCGPDGGPIGTNQQYHLPNHQGGCLLGRITKTGTNFYIGSRFVDTSIGQSGELFLACNDECYGTKPGHTDNSGQLTVTVTIV
jgi:hypothetical protein